MTREFEIRREVALAATPEQVWQAIATAAGLQTWFMAVEVEPADAGVTVWEPPHHLVVELAAAPDGATQAFEYLIEAVDGGSAVLRFVHSGFLGDDWGDEFEAMTGRGWDMYLHTLAQYFTYFPGLPATYIEAEGPQASAALQAWPVLLAALGATGEVAVGDEIRVTPPGLDPIAGTVDYLDPSLLGIRTEHALVRFHGRAAIGMAVAVGHHDYSQRVDAKEAIAAWEAWLRNAFA